MRNRAIQSNQPYTAPSDDVIDLDFTSRETTKTPHHTSIHSTSDDKLPEEVLLNYDGENVVDTHVLPFVRFHSKPPSSKSSFDFRSSSSTHGNVSESTQKIHDDAATNKLGSSVLLVNPEPHKNNLQNSNSDTRSSAWNYIDTFALVEIHSNVSDTMKKVNSLEESVVGLNSKIDDKVSGLDSKLDAILKSLSEVNTSVPTIVECEA